MQLLTQHIYITHINAFNATEVPSAITLWTSDFPAHKRHQKQAIAAGHGQLRQPLAAGRKIVQSLAVSVCAFAGATLPLLPPPLAFP
jgi:hypothetical protein